MLAQTIRERNSLTGFTFFQFMEFQVPQFVERKGRILGPLTVGQFAILGFFALILYILSRIIPIIYIKILGALIAVVAIGLIFGKIEGRSVLEMFKNFLGFAFISAKFYVWQRKPRSQKIIEKQEFSKETKEEYPSKELKQRRLEKLSSEIELKK